MTNPFNEIPLTNEQLPPSDASWKEILEDTDWDLLREQKERLQEIVLFLQGQLKKNKNNITKKELGESHFEAIDGLLNFIDVIQDAAANDIGEDKVFAHVCECGEKLQYYIVPDNVGNGLHEAFGCPHCDSRES